jgi:hypothetical protein
MTFAAIAYGAEMARERAWCHPDSRMKFKRRELRTRTQRLFDAAGHDVHTIRGEATP